MTDQLDFKYISGLVTQVQAGDSNAFAELFAATSEMQYAFAYRYLKDEQLAREALQDIYVYALKNLTKLQDPLLVMAWLNQRNLTVCFRLRARKVRQEAEESGHPLSDDFEPEKQSVEIDGQRYFVRLVMQLPFTQSQVILLRYLCGMTLNEIGDMLGLRRSEIRRHISGGIERLKGYYLSEGGAVQ